MDPIQVLGKRDEREVQVKDENTAGQLLVKNTLAEERYGKEEMISRLEVLSKEEADILSTLHPEPRMHS